MAWWDAEKGATPSHRDHTGDSEVPLTSPSRYTTDHSGGWWGIPLALLVGAGLVVLGIVVGTGLGGWRGVLLAVMLVAWGVSFLSQFGVLAWYVLQVPRLRARRVEAALDHQPPPAYTDDDVRQLHVPLAPTFGQATGKFGLLSPGDGPTPGPVRVTRVVGTVSATVMVVAALVIAVLGAATR